MTSPRCFVVRWNASWQHKPGWLGCQNFAAEPAYGVVRAFGSREAAETFRSEWEERTCRQPPRRHPFWDASCNPFWTVPTYEFDLGEVSSLEPPLFNDWLLDQGLTLPKPTWDNQVSTSDWYGWWEAGEEKMSAMQRAKVWEALDRVRFFEVAEVELGE
jgi:hypothetical protein